MLLPAVLPPLCWFLTRFLLLLIVLLILFSRKKSQLTQGEMPVLTSTSSPARRLAGPSSYTSGYGSSYSRSSSTFTSSSGVRTSSLDRSPYSSGYSYKYSSVSSSTSTRDYGRPPISSRSVTSSLPFSYSSTRTSPARSYFTTRKSTSEDGAGSSSSSRARETQSETRDLLNNNNNNNGSSSSTSSYLNGNFRRSRDHYSTSITPSVTSTSKYRTSGLSNGTGSTMSVSDRVATRSRYSSEREDPNSQSTKLSERIRQFQSSSSTSSRTGTEPSYRSRFLRSSIETKANDDDERPNVSDLRRRYDQNKNHVTSKPPSGASTSTLKPNQSNQTASESDTEPESTPSASSANKLASAVRIRRESPTPASHTEGVINGSSNKSSSPARVTAVVTKERSARSSSPSTLSTSSAASSDNETETKDGSGQVGARTLAKSGGTRSRHSSIDPEDSAVTSSTPVPHVAEASPSPKLAIRSRSYASRTPVPAQQTIRSAQQLVASNDQAGLVGLKNIGNTCFMNSVLQCLSNTRALLEYVISDEYANHLNTTTSSMNGALIKAFACVMADLWKKDEDDDDGYPSSAVNPTALKSQIQKFAPRFMGYNQQDAQEFLRYLLEGMHEDVNRVTVKPKPIEHDISDNLSDAEKALESWKRYLRRDDSKIVDMFVGQLKSTLQCTVCGHCSVTFDPFWDLSLPIPASSKSIMSSTKLQQCLELFVKEEILDGDEKPTCSKCQTRRKCTKKFTIHKFPQLLVLHLKRFSPGERFRKLEASVDFPLSDLDLSAYASPGVRPPTGTYQLYGVINHSGSAYMGHYTASCRHPFTNTWHEYNDSKVSNISAQRIISPEAYLLFYELEGREARL